MGEKAESKKTSKIIEPVSKSRRELEFESASRGYDKNLSFRHIDSSNRYSISVQKGLKRVVREFSSGGVVLKRVKSLPAQAGQESKRAGVEWLVARSNPSSEYPMDVWRLPKGWVDDREEGKKPGPMSSGEVKATEQDLQSAAVREVREEGGIEAKIITKIGTEVYVINSKLRKTRVLKFVTFYLMEWVKDLPESFGEETSEIQWLTYNNARNRLTHSGEKKILDKAQKLLDLGTQPTLV